MPGELPNIIPRELERLIDTLGFPKVLEIVRRIGGLTIYFPEKLTQDHFLVTLLGPDLARELCAYYQGDELSIPNMDRFRKTCRNQAIIDAYDNGDSIRKITLKHRLTDRQIRSIINSPLETGEGFEEMREVGGQLELF